MTDLNHYLKKVKAQEAADKMAAWYNELPGLPERAQVGCEKIESVHLYFETAFATLANSEVLSQHFRAAYMRLFSLKQHLEKQI